MWHVIVTPFRASVCRSSTMASTHPFIPLCARALINHTFRTRSHPRQSRLRHRKWPFHCCNLPPSPRPRGESPRHSTHSLIRRSTRPRPRPRSKFASRESRSPASLLIVDTWAQELFRSCEWGGGGKGG